MAPMLRTFLCRWAVGLALMLLGGAVSAQEGPGDAAERERILRDRAAAQERFEAARSDCEARFATTACLDAARAERRGSLERLKREEVVLDTALRRQRAADRMRRIQDKAREADARPPAAALPSTPGRGPMEKKVRQPARTPRAAAAPADPQASAATPRAAVPAPAAPVKRSAAPARRSDDAARRVARRQAYERRQAELQSHREAVQRRNAERAAKAKPAAPLPPRPGVPAQ
jgi:colicin import membrane protein